MPVGLVRQPIVTVGFLHILAALSAAATYRPSAVEAFVPSVGQQRAGGGVRDVSFGSSRNLNLLLRSTVSPVSASASSASAGDDDDKNAEFDPEHLARDPSAEAAASNKDSEKQKTAPHSHQHENDISLESYETIMDFNQELDKLAKRCLDDDPGRRDDVIGCAALAEGMLHRLQHLVRDADGQGDWAAVEHIIRPNTITINTVINAWSKASYSLAEGRGRGTPDTMLDTDMKEINVYTPSDAASRAMSILTEMEQAYLRGESEIAPDTTSYNSVIDAFAKSRGKNAAEKAEDLVDRMVHLSSGGEEGKEGVVNGSAEQWSGVRPDIITYNALIETLAYTPEGLDRAVELLEVLEKEYDETDNERLKPNIRTVNQVINAYAKHSMESSKRGYFKTKEEAVEAWKSAEKSRELLNKMKRRYEETGDEDFKPDAATYTTCCDAYARVGKIEAAERADALLKEMEQSKYVWPNFRTFTAVITAWANAPDKRSALRAEELLKKMEDVHAKALTSGKKFRNAYSVKPNARTYTSVINSWAKSRDPTKPQRALKILKKMIDLAKNGDESSRPTVYSYNAVIDACGRCQGTGEQQVQALKIAFAVKKAIDAAEGVEANEITFANLLRAAQYLIPAGEERNSVCKAVFNSARDAGLVDSSVLRALQNAADRSLFDEIAGETVDKKSGHVQFDTIPFEWRKNARRE